MKNQDHISGAVGDNRHNFGVVIAQSGGKTITFLGLVDHNFGVVNLNFGVVTKHKYMKNIELNYIITEKTSRLDHDLSLLCKEDRSLLESKK